MADTCWLLTTNAKSGSMQSVLPVCSGPSNYTGVKDELTSCRPTGEIPTDNNNLDIDEVATDDNIVVEVPLEQEEPVWQRPRSVEIKRSGYMEGLLRCLQHQPSMAEFVHALVEGHALFFAYSKVGCRVVEALVPHLRPVQMERLASEFLADVMGVCKHKYASRALCAVLRHQLASIVFGLQSQALMHFILDSTEDLFHHPHGHRLLLVLLEHGSPQLRSDVVQMLLQQAFGILLVCMDTFGSRVVMKAADVVSEQDLQIVAQTMVEEGIDSLLMTCMGVRVLEHMLRIKIGARCLLTELRWISPHVMGTLKRGLALSKQLDAFAD